MARTRGSKRAAGAAGPSKQTTRQQLHRRDSSHDSDEEENGGMAFSNDRPNGPSAARAATTSKQAFDQAKFARIVNTSRSSTTESLNLFGWAGCESQADANVVMCQDLLMKIGLAKHQLLCDPSLENSLSLKTLEQYERNANKLLRKYIKESRQYKRASPRRYALKRHVKLEQDKLFATTENKPGEPALQGDEAESESESEPEATGHDYLKSQSEDAGSVHTDVGALHRGQLSTRTTRPAFDPRTEHDVRRSAREDRQRVHHYRSRHAARQPHEGEEDDDHEHFPRRHGYDEDDREHFSHRRGYDEDNHERLFHRNNHGEDHEGISPHNASEYDDGRRLSQGGYQDDHPAYEGVANPRQPRSGGFAVRGGQKRNFAEQVSDSHRFADDGEGGNAEKLGRVTSSKRDHHGPDGDLRPQAPKGARR